MNEILMIAFAQYLSFAILLLITAKIDAYHFDRKHWVKDHKPRFIQRTVFIALIASISASFLHFIAFSLLWMGLFDLTLNSLRKHINNPYHLGKDAKWDVFWSKHPKTYKIMRFAVVAIAITIYILPYLLR